MDENIVCLEKARDSSKKPKENLSDFYNKSSIENLSFLAIIESSCMVAVVVLFCSIILRGK